MQTENILSYAFRSTEKVALQEIGPRFTLKLRSLRKGIPAVRSVVGECHSRALRPEDTSKESPEDDQDQGNRADAGSERVDPPKEDEFLWKWKVCISVPFTAWGR